MGAPPLPQPAHEVGETQADSVRVAGGGGSTARGRAALRAHQQWLVCRFFRRAGRRPHTPASPGGNTHGPPLVHSRTPGGVVPRAPRAGKEPESPSPSLPPHPPPPHTQHTDDLALAKAIQEQERVLMLLATSGGGGGGGAFAGPAGRAPTADGAAFYDDEAFARALQAEEDQARWMALAGVGPAGVDDNTEEDGTEGMTYEQLSTLTDAVGAVPRAASDAARARVTATRYRSGGDGGGGGGQEEEQCAVCRVELADGDAVSALPCGHAYHPDCIAAWLDRSKNCPVCGRELG